MDDTVAEPIPEALSGAGDRLRLARWHRGWKQADLHERSGVGKATINAAENGRRIPSIESLIKLADALGVPVEWLAFAVGPSGLPDGPPAYQPYSPRNKVSDEERALRRQLNQIAHATAQRHGTAFGTEQRALKEQVARERREAQEREDEAANLREAIDRYGFDLPY